MSLSFEKYTGLGNDFVFIDENQLDEPLTSLDIQFLCNRHSGIGADGVILVKPSSAADCLMWIFNADGSQAEMCGNALRCLYLYLNRHNPVKKLKYSVQTLERILSVQAHGEDVQCLMGDVASIEWDIELNVLNKTFTGHFLNTGVPHLVIPIQNIQKAPVLAWGSALRHHPYFHPEGVNVNFIALNSNQEILVRTYERGVESETQACGTGCAASAVVGSVLFGLKGAVRTQTALKNILEFEFTMDSAHLSAKSVKMIGPAQLVFNGEITLPRKTVVAR